MCILQAVVPSSAVHAVKELFVPSTRVASVKAEAEALPALDITKVFTQLRQDTHYINTVNPCLVLVQPRKTRPDIAEKLLTGT